jgi:leader peptidase (prepilin peptidase)/N-methyltransferase
MATPSDPPVNAARAAAPFVARIAAVFVVVACPAVIAGMPVPIVAVTVVLGFFLVALSSIDAATYRLPDAGTLPLIALGLTTAAVVDTAPWTWHAIGAVAGYVALWGVAWTYRRLRGADGLGLGDAKLAAAGGAWVGIAGLPTVLLVASLAALAFVAAMAALRQKERLRIIPFGPFLSIGIWYVWLYGPLG